MINISDNAFDKHVEHGDGVPLGGVPNNPAYEFGADCTVDFVAVQVGTASVPGNLSTPTTGPTLLSGVQYELRVSGKYTFANWASSTYPYAGMADAQCNFRIPPYWPTAGWVNGAELDPGGPWQYALEVNYGDGSMIPWTPDTCQETSNEYTATVAGAGSPISFLIRDDYYSDNSGALTVQIWQMTPAP